MKKQNREIKLFENSFFQKEKKNNNQIDPVCEKCLFRGLK